MSAEIVLGSISSVKDAVNWLSYTYLYVRMLRNPQLYGIGSSNILQDDPTLITKRQELVHSAASLLQKSHLIKYDRASGLL
jgi:pre-mRNA-splicing helicase BRR2